MLLAAAVASSTIFFLVRRAAEIFNDFLVTGLAVLSGLDLNRRAFSSQENEEANNEEEKGYQRGEKSQAKKMASLRLQFGPPFAKYNILYPWKIDCLAANFFDFWEGPPPFRFRKA